MTEQEIVDYLSDNGYPEHLVRGGSTGLVTHWKKFVSQVRHGYRLGLEDYRNDLDIRAIIRMVDLDREVQAEDELLQQALTAKETRIWESMEGAPWWDFGYPQGATEIEEALKEEGLL